MIDFSPNHCVYIINHYSITPYTKRQPKTMLQSPRKFSDIFHKRRRTICIIEKKHAAADPDTIHFTSTPVQTSS